MEGEIKKPTTEELLGPGYMDRLRAKTEVYHANSAAILQALRDGGALTPDRAMPIAEIAQRTKLVWGTVIEALSSRPLGAPDVVVLPSVAHWPYSEGSRFFSCSTYKELRFYADAILTMKFFVAGEIDMVEHLLEGRLLAAERVERARTDAQIEGN